jgi:hypothetical protein
MNNMTEKEEKNVVIDLSEPGYDSGVVAANSIQFSDVYDVPHVHSAIRSLFSATGPSPELSKYWDEYVERSYAPLSAYCECLDKECREDLLVATERYLCVASKYIKIIPCDNAKHEKKCEQCGEKFSRERVVSSGLYVCSCGLETESLSKSGCSEFYKSKNSKIPYDTAETFMKALSRFEGTSNDKIPVHMFDDLDAYFKHNYSILGIEQGRYYRSLPHLENGKKPGTSVTILLDAMKATGYPNYPIVNAIARDYWGWILPDLSDVREIILRDYEATQRIYDKIKKENKSSLNCNIRIYFHLKAIGYPCSTEDFKLVTGKKSIVYHNEMWRQMIEDYNVNSSYHKLRYVQLLVPSK